MRFSLNTADGRRDDCSYRIYEGSVVGLLLKASVGICDDGKCDGPFVGILLETPDGSRDKLPDSEFEGLVVGLLLKAAVGIIDD